MKQKDKLLRKIFILENIDAHGTSSVSEKEIAVQRFLELNHDYTMYEVCRAIKLNKGTYYHFIHDKVPKKQNQINDEILSKEIKKIYQETEGKIGKQKILTILQNKGYKTSKKKVKDLMNKMGLEIIIAKRYRPKVVPTTTRVYYRNKLNRAFIQEEPNKVWVSDFTEIKVGASKFYLCVILELFSRKVIAWKVSPKKGKSLATSAFKEAFVIRGEPRNLMFHSDQGAEFTSIEFCETLKSLGVIQSFSKPGNPYDNAVMESFFSIIKREEIYRNKYLNYMDLKAKITQYMHFYNNLRPHKTLNYKTPNQFELEYLQCK